MIIPAIPDMTSAKGAQAEVHGPPCNNPKPKHYCNNGALKRTSERCASSNVEDGIPQLLGLLLRVIVLDKLLVDLDNDIHGSAADPFCNLSQGT